MKIKQINIKKISEKSFSVFSTEKWLNLYGKNLKCYGIFDKSDNIIGGFSLYIQKKAKVLKYYRNPPFGPTINLFFENKAQNKAKILSENKKILKLLSNFLEKLPYHILSIYLPNNYVDMQPFIWKKFKVIPNYTYIINLEKDINEIEKDFSTERRNDIKKAIKDGVTTRITSDYNLIKPLILSTFTRKEKSVDIKMIDKILFEFAEKENSFAYISYQNNKAIATSFCVYDKEKAYYLLGGYDSKNKHQGAGALAVFNAIKHSKKLGIKKFDFEGSMLPEVEKYFRGFGGDLTPYFSINKAKMPIEIALKFIKRSTF